jgi:sterol desaturase/sphingolipid hydroxylase (fatty acid hydroxylase superfamily)
MNLLLWLLPPITIFAWLFVEKYVYTRRFYLSDKDSTIIKLEILSIALRLFLSFVIFFPLLGLLVPFNVFSFSNLDIHPAINFFLCFLLIDFFHYLTHRIHHSIPFLWRFHRLHHSDKDVDVMTSWLHHPFEAISIYLIITFLFVVFDIPLEFIYWYSIIFILHVAFTHTKMYVPDHIDSWLRYLIVTPNAHRLHHSTDMKEGNSNFGQIFLFWDVLFKTHMKTSSNKIHFGIRSNETPQKSSLKYFLINPFK